MKTTGLLGTLCIAVALAGCSAPTEARRDGGALRDAAGSDAMRDDAASSIDGGDPGIDAAGDDAGETDAGSMEIDAGSTARGASLVPLYSYPTDSTWARFRAACEAHPTVRVVAVVNPASGPTPSVEPAYAAAIPGLVSSGAEVIGYVATGYAGRDASVVHAEIDLYRAQYPDLVGIFFDETQATEPGHEDYYRELVAYSRAAGLPFTVGNSGTGIELSYDGIFDMILVYESAGEVSTSTLARYAGSVPDHFGIIPYAVGTLDPTYVASVTPTVRWVYVTDDDLPNPWDTLPAYFDSLLAALE